MGRDKKPLTKISNSEKAGGRGCRGAALIWDGHQFGTLFTFTDNKRFA